MGHKKRKRVAARNSFKFKTKAINPTKPAYTTVAEFEDWLGVQKRALVASKQPNWCNNTAKQLLTKRVKIKKPKPIKKDKAYWVAQYLLPQWLKRRSEILMRDNYRCTKCQSISELQVHHLRYDYTKDVWDYIDTDLITLCHSCHEHVHAITPIKEFYK